MTRHRTTLPRSRAEDATSLRGGAGASPDAHHIDSTELFRGTRRLTIRHEQNTYYLQVTRNGKLILTK